MQVEKLQFFLKVYIKMIKTEKSIIKFGDIEIEKHKSHQNKKPTSIKNIDIKKIVVSSIVSFGKKSFKYLIGFKEAKKMDLYVYFFRK